MNNLKQIYLGIMMYVQDNDNWFPRISGTVASDTWPPTVMPYLDNNSAVLNCPSQNFYKSISSTKSYSFTYNGTTRTSGYGLFSFLSLRNTAAIMKPTDMPIAADTNRADFYQYYSGPAWRHPGRSLYDGGIFHIFFDGHIEFHPGLSQYLQKFGSYYEPQRYF